MSLREIALAKKVVVEHTKSSIQSILIEERDGEALCVVTFMVPNEKGVLRPVTKRATVDSMLTTRQQGAFLDKAEALL